MNSTELVKAKKRSMGAIDNQGTKMYAPPELAHLYPDLASLNFPATSHMDVWSLGCVLCEVLFWTICGHRGLDEFLHLRQQDPKAIYPRHKSQGYSGCFHDGFNRLKAVDDMIQPAIDRGRRFDDITKSMGGFLREEILIPKSQRLTAQLAASRLEYVLDNLKHLRPETPIHSNPVRSVNGPSVRQLQGPYTSSGGVSTHSRYHTIDSYPLARDASSRQFGTATTHLTTGTSTSIQEDIESGSPGAIPPRSSSTIGRGQSSFAPVAGNSLPRSPTAPVGSSAPVSNHVPFTIVISFPADDCHPERSWLNDGFSRTPPNVQGSPQESALSPSPTNRPYLTTPEQIGIRDDFSEVSDEGKSVQRSSSVRSRASGSKQLPPLGGPVSAEFEMPSSTTNISRSPSQTSRRIGTLENIPMNEVSEWVRKKKEAKQLRQPPPSDGVMKRIKDRDQVCFPLTWTILWQTKV